MGEPRDPAADAAEADQAERAAAELRDIGGGPSAGVGAGVQRAGVMGQFEHQRDGVLGHRVVAVVDGVADRDAEPARGVEVDEADGAGATERDATHVGGDALQ